MRKNLEKYQGIFPAFYACYDASGAISPDAVRALTEYLLGKGVQGLYVGGSSGECIYQSVAERKSVLENVMAVARGRAVVIAHVACNSTADSMELAAHAECLGVDAIASIPPIYFHLPDRAVAKYWNDISSAAPNTDFVIYNIPQLAGVALSGSLLRTMLENPNVIGVKNSSMPVQDIEMWRDEGAIVFNGPDEQLLSGLAAGAAGGIGGTYGVMPELYLKIYELTMAGKIREALPIQDACCQVIYRLCSGQSNMYAMIKEVIRDLGGPDIGDVRAPLYPLQDSDRPIAAEAAEMIRSLSGMPVEASSLSRPSQHNRTVVGICPRCGRNVVEGPKSFYCEAYRNQPPCRFALWKDNRFFSGKGKQITKRVAEKLLKDGRVHMTKLHSEKTGSDYDAVIVMEDTGEYVNFRLEFDRK